jgi:dihydroorotase
MAPPLRTKRDAAALQKALKDGIIDMIATDHAPHSLLDKAVEFDCACNGIVGLESALSTTLELVHCGVLSKSQFAQTLTINPAKLLNIPFGTLSKNSQADVVIVDPNKEFVFSVEDIFSKSQNSPFLGKKLKGQVSLTIVGGKVVYDKESRHADT